MENSRFIFQKKLISKLVIFLLIIDSFMFTDAWFNQSYAAPVINEMNINTTDNEISVSGTGDGNGVPLADKPFRYSIGSSQSEWVRDSSNVTINETLTSGALSNTQLKSNILTLAPETSGGGIQTTSGGLEGYAYSKVITIDHAKVDSELMNFPATVYLNNANFDFSKCKPDGSDIRFTDENHSQLKFEKEEYNSVSGSAVINVLVPKVSNVQDTEIMMWYGNPSAYSTSVEAWQDQTGKQLTYNGNVKFVPNAAKFGKAGYFDGSGDYISIPDSADLNLSTDRFTINFTLNPSSIATAYQTVMSKSTATDGWYISYYPTSNYIRFYAKASSAELVNYTFAITPRQGILADYELCRDGSSLTLRENGKLLTATAVTAIGTKTIPNAGNLVIGSLHNLTELYIGYMDEIQIAIGVARHSADFIPPQTPYTADAYTKLLLPMDDFNAMRIATSATGADKCTVYKEYTADSTKTHIVEAEIKVETSGTTYASMVEAANGSKFADIYIRSGSVVFNATGTSPYTLTVNTTSVKHKYKVKLNPASSDCEFFMDDVLMHTAPYANLLSYSGLSAMYVGDAHVGANCGGSSLVYCIRHNPDYGGNPTGFTTWNASETVLPTAQGWIFVGTATLATLLFKDETGKTSYTYGDVKPIKTAYADGARGAYFDGSGDYFSTSGITEISASGSNMTIESKVVFTALPANGYTAMIYSKYSSSPLNTLYVGLLNNNGTNQLIFYSYLGGLDFRYNWTPVLNVPYDLAFEKDGNSFKMFINGSLVGTTSNSNDVRCSSPSYIGYYGSSSYYFTGNIAGLRVTQDTARYSGTYTPPSKFEIDSDKVVFNSMFDTIYDQNYAMVQHMGDTLVDATGNGNNGTATGTTVVNTDYGKARNFNGTSDCITTTLYNNPSKYTAVALLKYKTAKHQFWLVDDGAGYGYSGMDSGTTIMSAVYDTAGRVASYPVTDQVNNYKSYISKFDSGGYLRIYEDGIQKATSAVTVANVSNVATALKIGKAANYYINAEIAELRYSNIARSDAWIKAESLSLKNELLTLSMYAPTGTRESEAYDISGYVTSSRIDWNQAVPMGTSITVESNVSLDGGSSWLGWKPCTSGAVIADLDGSTDTSNARLKLRQTLSTSSSAITPSLSNSIITIGMSKYVHRITAEPNKEYTVRFDVKDANGSITTETRTAYTKAQTPQFTVSGKTVNSVDLLFTDTNPAVTEYQIECDSRYVNSSGVLTSVPTWITLGGKEITILGLNIGTMYSFTAKARNSVKEETDYASPIYTGTEGIPIPSGSAVIAAAALNNSVTVAWNEITNSLSYELEIDGVVKNVGLKTHYTSEGLMTATQHIYRVRGRNQGGFSEWSEPCIITTTSNLPLIPASVLAKASDDTVAVYWDTAQDALTYTVEIAGTQITDVERNSACLFGLEPETSYTYKVKACNLVGESEWTETGSITTHTLDTPEITMKQMDSNEIRIGWNKIEGATAYKIALDADENFDEISGSELDEFTTSSAIIYTHSNLPAKTAHVYRVRAICAGGDSEWSDAVTLETRPQRPDVPGHFRGSASNNFITLIWDAVEDVIGYDLEVDGIVIENKDTTQYQYKGLDQYTEHTYRVRSVTTEMQSYWSDMLKIRTLGGVPDEPKNVVINNSRGIATLCWDKTPGAQIYDIEVNNNNIYSISDETFIYGNIELIPSSSAIYRETAYRIRSGNELGKSDWTDTFVNNAIMGQIEKGKELDLGLTASNITDFSRYTLYVNYNAGALTVTDLCAYSVEKELVPGRVEGYDIEIVSFVPGHIVFQVNKIVDEGYLWTGIINNIKFIGNATGGTTLTYTAQCVKD